MSLIWAFYSVGMTSNRTLFVLALSLAPLANVAHGDFIYTGGSQRTQATVQAATGPGVPPVSDSFDLSAPTAIATWTPPEQNITASVTGANAQVHSTFSSVVEPTHIHFYERTFEARAAANRLQPPMASFTSQHTFQLSFSIDEPTQARVFGYLSREHPSGWASISPCFIKFGPEGGSPIVSLVYSGGTSHFTATYNQNVITLPSGDYEISVSSPNGWNAGSTGIFRDELILDIEIVPPPVCAGDTNGDNAVNGADLSVLLANFGQSATGPDSGDFNNDGQCNGADLSVLLSQFGTTCG